MESFLTGHSTQVAAIRVDWAKWRQSFRGMQENPLVERIFASGVEIQEAGGGSSDWRGKIQAAGRTNAMASSAQAVRDVVGSVLRVKPDSLRDDQPLTDLGLDSLMGVEIENLIESSIGVALPPTSLMRARTIGQIASLIAEHLGGGADRPSQARGSAEAAASTEESTSIRSPTRISTSCWAARSESDDAAGKQPRSLMPEDPTSTSQTMAGERGSPPPAAHLSAAGIVGNLAGPGGGSRQPHLWRHRDQGGDHPEQCEAALQRVIDRQEAMRISFLPGKERPLQMIRTTVAAVLGFRELVRRGDDLKLEDDAGNLPAAVRSAARAAPPGGHDPARRERPCAGVFHSTMPSPTAGRWASSCRTSAPPTSWG